MSMNVYDDAGVLPMAIRMRRQRICPAEIDNIYGEIIKGIVKMATLLLPKEDPRYTMHLEEFMSEDVQSLMIVNAIRSADTLVDTKSSPRNIVNYLTKAVQNRLWASGLGSPAQKSRAIIAPVMARVTMLFTSMRSSSFFMAVSISAALKLNVKQEKEMIRCPENTTSSWPT